MFEHRDEKNTGDLGSLTGMVEAVRADAPAERMWQDARRNLMGRLEASQQESIITRVFPGSRSRKIGWAAALGIVVVVVALLVGLNPWARGPGQAFATAVEQLRSAQTVTFTMIIEMESPLPTMRQEMAFKEPGYARAEVPSAGIVTILDMTQGKGVILNSTAKSFMEMDVPVPPADQPAIGLVEQLRTSPDRADELLGEREMDGRRVLGFLVTREGKRMSVWVDAETWDLVRVEGGMNEAGRVVLTDFRFNVELDDSLFSLTPPEGYTRQEVQWDMSELSEQDLVGFLRFWAEYEKDGLFPPTFDQAKLYEATIEMLKGSKAAQAAEEELSESEGMRLTLSVTRGTMFVYMMKPDNDWHYAGEGVQLGEAAVPICWWRPDGSDTYRVVYGDLSVEDMAPEDVPSAQEKQDAE
jgi:outer membrane lipoprotein-sorting protein